MKVPLRNYYLVKYKKENEDSKKQMPKQQHYKYQGMKPSQLNSVKVIWSEKLKELKVGLRISRVEDISFRRAI